MKKYLILSILIALLFGACKKDEDEVMLEPNAGSDQVTIPLNLFTIDGSATKGPAGYSIEWSYEGPVAEEEIQFQNTNTLNPTFIPPENGLYYFTLTIKSGGNTASDQVKVEVSGAIQLGGTLVENLELKNIEQDPEEPDYMIISDLVVPNNLKLSVIEEGVVVHVIENKGIIIQEGGELSNYNSNYDKGYNLILKSSTSWKGIWVDGGSITLQDARIENAGGAKFENQVDAAALLLSSNTTITNNFSNNVFVNSLATDFLIDGNFSINGYFSDNRLSNKIPLMVPFSFITYVNDDNVFPADYDYIHLKVDETVVESHPASEVFKMNGEKYYLDGTLHLSESLYITLGSHIYMKEESGIVMLGGRLSVQEWIGEGNIIFEGLDSSNWTGIACADSGSISLINSTILGAGYGLFDTELFQSEYPATIYEDNNMIFRFINSEIKNSGGYGIYYTGQTGVYIRYIENSKFENTTQPAIRTTVRAMNFTLNQDHGNIFAMNDGIAAVQIDQDLQFYNLQGTWPALGGDNFYRINTDLIREIDAPFTLEPGVNLKFASDKTFVWDYDFNDLYAFKALGTADMPIIFDSENQNSKWGGMKLSGQLEMMHCHIKNAGSILLPDAPVKTNVFMALNPQSSSYPDLKFQNNIVSGSEGYGAIINENVTPSSDPSNPDNNNIFSNNTLGDYYYTSK